MNKLTTAWIINHNSCRLAIIHFRHHHLYLCLGEHKYHKRSSNLHLFFASKLRIMWRSCVLFMPINGYFSIQWLIEWVFLMVIMFHRFVYSVFHIFNQIGWTIILELLRRSHIRQTIVLIPLKKDPLEMLSPIQSSVETEALTLLAFMAL